jgi:hypothetical protein
MCSSQTRSASGWELDYPLSVGDPLEKTTAGIDGHHDDSGFVEPQSAPKKTKRNDRSMVTCSQ